MPSRADRAYADARVGPRRDARMAGALRHATLINRLVTHARSPGGEALSDSKPKTGRPLRPSSTSPCPGRRHTQTHSPTADGQRLLGAIGRDARYLPNEVPRRLLQPNHLADRDDAAVDDWHELSVANPTFLLVILGC
jgi:hypothetical protein